MIRMVVDLSSETMAARKTMENKCQKVFRKTKSERIECLKNCALTSTGGSSSDRKEIADQDSNLQE